MLHGARLALHRKVRIDPSTFEKTTGSILASAIEVTYLRLTDCPAGLLINFNVPRLMDGVKRLINPSARGREL